MSGSRLFLSPHFHCKSPEKAPPAGSDGANYALNQGLKPKAEEGKSAFLILFTCCAMRVKRSHPRHLTLKEVFVFTRSLRRMNKSELSEPAIEFRQGDFAWL
jgi:hypothetical protein